MKIKEIKIVNQDKSTEIANIGADAINVDYNNTTVKAELDRLNTSNSSLINIQNSLQSQINGLASGSPLVADSVAQMTNTNRVYVNTTDGHWYYYEDGWKDGGVYQATEVASDSIKLAHINKDIYGSEYSIITEAGTSYPRITFMHPTLSNITKWKIKFKIKKDYISTNSNFVVRLLRGVTPSGAQSSYVERSIGLNSSSLTDEYQTFEYEHEEETALNSLNGFALRININNSTITTDWSVQDIQFFLNDALMPLTLVRTETFCPYVADISEDKSFIASKNYVKNIIDKYNTEFNNKIEELDSIINYDSIKKSNLYTIACWGDSITAGGYPSALQSKIGDNVEVVNRGVGGQCSGMIAFRQGGNIVTAGEDFTIPASNETSVSFSYNISSGSYKNFSNVHTANVTINGIAGVISLTNTGNATFTRSENGEATEITADTQIVSSQAIHDNDLAIIMCGVNDVAFARDYINGVVQNVQAMVNNLKPTIKRFLILSTTTTTGQTTGTAGNTAVTNINNQLRGLYPNNFVDLEDYLINHCIYDMGLTPTAEDLDKMENGTLPPQIMADSTHPSPETRPYIANFIYNELNLRGWIQK